MRTYISSHTFVGHVGSLPQYNARCDCLVVSEDGRQLTVADLVPGAADTSPPYPRGKFEIEIRFTPDGTYEDDR